MNEPLSAAQTIHFLLSVIESGERLSEAEAEAARYAARQNPNETLESRQPDALLEAVRAHLDAARQPSVDPESGIPSEVRTFIYWQNRALALEKAGWDRAATLDAARQPTVDAEALVAWLKRAQVPWTEAPEASWRSVAERILAARDALAAQETDVPG